VSSLVSSALCHTTASAHSKVFATLAGRENGEGPGPHAGRGGGRPEISYPFVLILLGMRDAQQACSARAHCVLLGIQRRDHSNAYSLGRSGRSSTLQPRSPRTRSST
jgi:hypothetical protein